MKLTDEWFTALSESENGNMILVARRAKMMDFVKAGKIKERDEIYWKYNGDANGMPDSEAAKQMEASQEAIRKIVEKDKLAILTGVYVGDNERTMVFITRNIPAFGEKLNLALKDFDLLPIEIYTEKDPDNEEYLDMYEMKENAIE